MHIIAPHLIPYKVKVLEVLYPIIGSMFACKFSNLGKNSLYLSGSPAKSIYATSTKIVTFLSSAAAVFTVFNRLSQSSRVKEYQVGL